MESPNSKGSSTLVVGLFAFVALIVGAGFVVFMGASGIFSSELRLTTIFKDARGLNVGAPVYLSGVDVGRVLGKSLPLEGENGVVVSYSVDGRYSGRVRSTTSASISSAGMLGDKTLVLYEGEGGDLVKSGGEIPSRDEEDLSAYIVKGGQALENIRKLTKSLAAIFADGKTAGKIEKILGNLEVASLNLKKNTEGDWGKKLDHSLTRLESVMTKIDKGQGTLGALVNDASLHEDLRILLGGAKRSKLVHFLVHQAIKNKEEKSASEQASPAKE